MSYEEENEMIEVIIVEPGEEARTQMISNDYEEMHDIVGGWIETYAPFEDPVLIVCNEEGKLEGLPLNRAIFYEDSDRIADVICGTFFMVYAPEDAEDFKSLPDELKEKYLEKFRYPERFFRTANGIEMEKIPLKIKAENTR